MSLCPCGSSNTYAKCCGLFIENNELAQTPEQLMRSRYTAYSLGKIDYIEKTMKGKALLGFNAQEAKLWASSVTWLGLELVRAEPTDSEVGFVQFIARFREQGKIQMIHELSEFHKENGTWLYVSGENKPIPPKVTKVQTARNAPCPCGSGKKFKNCHAK